MWRSWLWCGGPGPCPSLGVFSQFLSGEGLGRAGEGEGASSERRNGEGKRSEASRSEGEEQRDAHRGWSKEGISGAEGGEEERGAVPWAPQAPRDRPAPAARTEQRHHQLQKRCESSQCCLGTQGAARLEAHSVCRHPELRPHAVPSILAWSGPGSPSGCSSQAQALPAGSPAVTVCQALCAHPQSSWSQRFSQNACDTAQWWSRWGEGFCGVLRLLRCSCCPGSAHLSRLVPGMCV